MILIRINEKKLVAINKTDLILYIMFNIQFKINLITPFYWIKNKQSVKIKLLHEMHTHQHDNNHFYPFYLIYINISNQLQV